MTTVHVVNLMEVLSGLRELASYDVDNTDPGVLRTDLTQAKTLATQILALPIINYVEIENNLAAAREDLTTTEETLATRETELRNNQQLLRSAMQLNDRLAATPANGATTGSTRFPDAPMFSGEKPDTLRPFKTQLRLKIAAQPTQFLEPQSQLRYAFSRLEGPALALVNSYVLPDNTIGLESLNELLAHLDRAYDDPDRAGTADRELQRLRQKNRPFSSYYADFTRIMSDLDYNDSSKLAALKRGLCDEIKETLRVTINEPTGFNAFVDLCQKIDNKNRAYAADRPAPRTAAPRAPNPTPAPRASTSNQYTPAPTPRVSSAHPTNANSGHYGPAPMNLSANRRKLSPEERQRRIDHNLCFYCADKDHVTRNCPHRPPPRQPLQGAVAELQQAPMADPISDAQGSGNA
jgi:hypothetical protein